LKVNPTLVVVDGDPLLTAIVDFPCPGDELAPMLRKMTKIFCCMTRLPFQREGRIYRGNRLDQLCDTNTAPLQDVAFILADADVDWLLMKMRRWCQVICQII